MSETFGLSFTLKLAPPYGVSKRLEVVLPQPAVDCPLIVVLHSFRFVALVLANTDGYQISKVVLGLLRVQGHGFEMQGLSDVVVH